MVSGDYTCLIVYNFVNNFVYIIVYWFDYVLKKFDYLYKKEYEA